ncbi:MAG TPA: phage tail protein [Polyangia bacterium]|nr:phage tail protein [Polyangia bacterium]
MSIGVLGPITFEVSADLVRTWQEAKRSGGARWAKHDVFGGQPVKEFIGPDLEQMNLSVRLDSQFGLVPSDELKQMRLQRDTGAVMQLTMGGELIGDFTLEHIDEDQRRFGRDGTLLMAIVSLTLEEYA